jgi:hypothetical protein
MDEVQFLQILRDLAGSQIEYLIHGLLRHIIVLDDQMGEWLLEV